MESVPGPAVGPGRGRSAGRVPAVAEEQVVGSSSQTASRITSCSFITRSLVRNDGNHPAHRQTPLHSTILPGKLGRGGAPATFRLWLPNSAPPGQAGLGQPSVWVSVPLALLPRRVRDHAHPLPPP